MIPEVKKKIDQIRCGIVPEGYKKTKGGIVPVEWTEYAIADCLKRVERPVEVKPDEMYTQIGIRSHGKGLFYKEPVNGKSLGNKSVFWIEPNCFVLNIVFAWEQAIGKTTQKEVGMIGSHRFPMYQPINERIDIDYLISYLMTKRGKDILEEASRGGAGRNRTLGQERFMNSKIVLPTPIEQKKIAAILTMQDKVIELEREKIEEIKKVKRFFLEKMFPKKSETVPEIRFKGFTTPWEQRKFEECFGERRERTETENEDTLLSCAINGMFLNSELFGHFRGTTTIGYLKVKKNDLILSAQNLHLGNANVNLRFEHGIISPAYKVYDLINCEPNFVQAWVKKEDTKNFFLAATTEGASQCRKNIEWSTLKRQIIMMPSYEEQEKIGQYFANLDNLITLHQRKLEEEKKKKKALMQLLLTGTVRVSDEEKYN